MKKIAKSDCKRGLKQEIAKMCFYLCAPIRTSYKFDALCTKNLPTAPDSILLLRPCVLYVLHFGLYPLVVSSTNNIRFENDGGFDTRSISFLYCKQKIRWKPCTDLHHSDSTPKCFKCPKIHVYHVDYT